VKTVFPEENKKAFDPNAQFDFDRSAESQRIVDEFLKLKNKGIDFDCTDLNTMNTLLEKINDRKVKND
jgi:hypothetical protein